MTATATVRSTTTSEEPAARRAEPRVIPFIGALPDWRRPASWGMAPWGLATVVLALVAGGLASVAPGAPWIAVVVGAGAAATLAVTAWRWGQEGARDPLATAVRGAIENAPEAYLVTDASGRGRFANESFRRLFPDRDPDGGLAFLGSTVVDAMTGDGDGNPAGTPRDIRIPGGGDERWIRLWGFGSAAGEGNEDLRLWRLEDVTRARAVATAREAEMTRLTDFVDHLPVGFFSVDGEGRFLYANQVLGEWLGVAPAALCREGRRFADFVTGRINREPPAIPDLFGADRYGDDGAVLLRGRGGEPFRAYLVQSECTGSRNAFVHSRSVVLRGMEPMPDAGSAASPAQRIRWLYDDAPVGIALIDLDGTVTDCNRAWLRLLGLHRDAVVDRPLSERLSLEDRGDVAAQLSKVVMGTQRAAHLEVRMPVSTRRDVAASLYASRMADADGEVSGLILHFIDTTEQKHLEVQFTQFQKMQAIGQLAGGIAHDFNNLLTAMIGFCDLLLERHPPTDPSFADIMQIKQNANRATNLVRQLLAFSRKQTLKPVMIHITEALTNMADLLRRLMGENFDVVFEHGEDLGLVRVDPGQIDQVIVNLAVNARDAMPGGGTFTIRTSRVRLEESAEQGGELILAGDYVRIEVMDSGVGIRKENIGRIFEPFFSTKEVGAGTGLGLSTVYGIIKQTEGFIFVDSAPGEGTCFSIYLPRFDADQAEADPGTTRSRDDPAEPADLTGVGTVLLVEDEDAVRLFGARALRNKGYRVLEAGNGEEGLDVINTAGEPVDLIISDVVMPGMDGHTFVRLVRQEMPAVKFILMSGYAEDVAAEELWNDPTLHFLPKPFSLKALAGKVKEVMAG